MKTKSKKTLKEELKKWVHKIVTPFTTEDAINKFKNYDKKTHLSSRRMEQLLRGAGAIPLAKNKKKSSKWLPPLKQYPKESAVKINYKEQLTKYEDHQ